MSKQFALLVWILMYSTMQELIRVIGGAKMRRMFFEPLRTTEPIAI